MPHASESRRIEDPFGATDEVKVYKDEGEDEKPENLSEEKFGLVTETEEVKNWKLYGRDYKVALFVWFFSKSAVSNSAVEEVNNFLIILIILFNNLRFRSKDND